VYKYNIFRTKKKICQIYKTKEKKKFYFLKINIRNKIYLNIK